MQLIQHQAQQILLALAVQRHRQYAGSSFNSVWAMKTMKLCAVSFAFLPQCDSVSDVVVGLCDVQLLPTWHACCHLTTQLL